MPWLSGVPTRCTHAAQPAPRTNPTTAPSVSQVASTESSRLSAAHRAASENGTANTSATRAAGADGVPVPALAHGVGHGGGPNGDGRPSLPGLRMPCGSSACLTAPSTPIAGAERLGHEAAAVDADAVVVREVAAVGQHGALAGVPQGDVRRLDLRRAAGRRRT